MAFDTSPGRTQRPCAGAELGRTKDALTLPWRSSELEINNREKTTHKTDKNKRIRNHRFKMFIFSSFCFCVYDDIHAHVFAQMQEQIQKQKEFSKVNRRKTKRPVDVAIEKCCYRRE